jgi:hypothetical protein
MGGLSTGESTIATCTLGVSAMTAAGSGTGLAADETGSAGAETGSSDVTAERMTVSPTSELTTARDRSVNARTGAPDCR